MRREVARLDHRAEVLTEKYNAARAALDELNIRLGQTRADLERSRAQLDAAQALRNERLVTMYKSDGYDLLDVLFNLDDLGEAGTQLGYFRAIDKADQDTVTRIAGMEKQIQQLTRQIEDDRSEALKREMGLREQQAAIEDELGARQQLLTDLDAQVKKLLAQQAKLDAAASARLAKAAGVDIGHHPRHAGPDRRGQGDDEVPRHPLRVGRGDALGRVRLLGPRALRVRQVRHPVPARRHDAGAHGPPGAAVTGPAGGPGLLRLRRPSTTTWASTSATDCSSRRRTPATWSR